MFVNKQLTFILQSKTTDKITATVTKIISYINSKDKSRILQQLTSFSNLP